MPYKEWAKKGHHVGAISADKKRLAAVRRSCIYFLDAASGKETPPFFQGHENILVDVAVAPDNSMVATMAEDVRLWEPGSGKLLRRLRFPYTPATAPQVWSPWGSVRFSPDGKMVAALWLDALKRVEFGFQLLPPTAIYFWDTASGKELKPLVTEDALVSPSSLVFSPDGRVLAFFSSADLGAIIFWSPAGRKETRRIPFPSQGGKIDLAFSPDGKMIAAAAGELVVWDVASGRKLKTFAGFRALAFSKDGKILAGAGVDIILWEMPSFKKLATLKGHKNEVRSLAFSSDNLLLASGSWDNSVRLWDLAEKQELHRFDGHLRGVQAVAFSPNGKMLVSASIDTTALIWDVDAARKMTKKN